jgi:DNA-binding PucR family transcriptional regulator
LHWGKERSNVSAYWDADEPRLDTDDRFRPINGEALDAIRSASAVLDARWEEFAEAIVTARQTPDLGDQGLVEAVYRASAGNYPTLAATLPDHLLPIAVQVPPQAVDLGRVFARRDAPRRWVLELYRYGANLAYGALMQELLLPTYSRDVLAEALPFAFQRFSGYVDAAVESTMTEYAREWAITHDHAVARRLALIREVLAGATPLDDHQQVSQRLGHDLALQQTGVVLSFGAGPLSPERLSSAERLLRDIAGALGAAVLIVPSGASELWAWLGTRNVPALEHLRDFAARIDALGLRLAVGDPHAGPQGFRLSHREAVRTEETVRTQVAARPVTFYGSIAAVALVSGDAAHTRTFIAAELGSLADDDDAARRLRATVRTYLELGLSITATADAMHLHTNSIRYRLRQAEQRRGRPLGERRFELEFALRLIDKIGPSGAATTDSRP